MPLQTRAHGLNLSSRVAVRPQNNDVISLTVARVKGLERAFFHPDRSIFREGTNVIARPFDVCSVSPEWTPDYGQRAALQWMERCNSAAAQGTMEELRSLLLIVVID